MRRARVKDERQWPTPSSSLPPSLPWPSPLFPHTASSHSPSGLVSPLWTKSMGITIDSVEDAAVAWEVNGADEDGDRKSVVRFASYICHVADVLGSSAVVGGEGHRGRADCAQLCLAWMSLLRLPPKRCTSGSRRPGSAATGTGVDNPPKMACTCDGTSRLFYMIVYR
nr:uncharacterized protein LOC127345141 isoform X2 [Lolium perenne]